MKIVNKIMIVIIAIIIIAGISMIALKGFNYSLLYSKTQRLNIYMTKEFKVSEIEEIAKEALGTNKLKVQLANSFGTVASIVATEITEEQQNSIIEKINEKYEVEINKENDVVLTEIPQADVWDLISKYISPLAITTIVVLVYFAIRFRKQEITKWLVMPIISLIIVSVLYVSIIALARIPINEFFAIIAVLIYILTLICNTIKLTKEEI